MPALLALYFILFLNIFLTEETYVRTLFTIKNIAAKNILFYTQADFSMRLVHLPLFKGVIYKFLCSVSFILRFYSCDILIPELHNGTTENSIYGT